jgi:hypothetical protein
VRHKNDIYFCGKLWEVAIWIVRLGVPHPSKGAALVNCPTQAKSGLEWATGSLSGGTFRNAEVVDDAVDVLMAETLGAHTMVQGSFAALRMTIRMEGRTRTIRKLRGAFEMVRRFERRVCEVHGCPVGTLMHADQLLRANTLRPGPSGPLGRTNASGPTRVMLVFLLLVWFGCYFIRGFVCGGIEDTMATARSSRHGAARRR